MKSTVSHFCENKMAYDRPFPHPAGQVTASCGTGSLTMRDYVDPACPALFAKRAGPLSSYLKYRTIT